MRQKKLFIDGLGLVEGHFSGIGHYILGMCKGFDELLEQKKLAGEDHPDVTVIIPYDTMQRFRSFGFKNLKVRRLPISFHLMSILWQRGRMPPLDAFFGRGHYLFTRFVSMPLLFSPSSLIIYDLSFELHPEFADEGNAIFLSAGIKKSLRKTKTVFTISNSVRGEIIDFYKLSPEQVHVAYPGVDQRYFFKRPKQQIEEVKRNYGIEGEYILALSNLEPRKNLEGLVDAYCDLPQTYRDKYGLLVVGVSGWKTDELFQKVIGKVREGYNIMRPNKYVLDKDIPAIISGAKMLVYPSHYEGFGMPPLEALACGVPVISADNSSLPEAVGDNALMIDPSRNAEIKKAIIEVLDDWPSYAKRTRKTGPEHADNFYWLKTAQVYWDAIVGGAE